MAEDLISSIIDNPAIEAEIKKVEARLSELATTIKTFPKAQVFYDASGAKDLSTANKELSVVLSQLKVKNAELTNSIKEQQLAEKQLAAQRKEAAAAQKEADRQASIATKQRIADEKAAAAAADIASKEKLRALAAQAKAQEELDALQKDNNANVGLFDTTGQAGGAKLKSNSVPEPVFTPSNKQESLLLNLSETEALLKQNKAAQKDLNDQLEKGSISQAKYDEAIVAAKQEEIAYKANISATNKELKARQTLNDSAAGSIDAARAENALLVPQRNAIVAKADLATPEDLARIKELNAEIDKNNDLIDKNTDLLGRQKINIGNYPNAFGGAFKTLNTELEQVQGKLVSGNFQGKEFDQLTAKLNVLKNATALTGKEFTTVAQQQKAYAEASTQIGLVYGKNSQVFKDFSTGVKEGNVNIKGLATEVSSVATKGKGFMSFLSQAYGGIRKLAYAIPGIGIGGIILLLLGPLEAAGAALIKYGNTATKAGRDFVDLEDHIKNTNAVIEKSGSTFETATAQVSKLTEDVKLAKEGFINKNEVLKEYNDTMGKTTGKLKDFDAVEKKIIDSGQAYIQLMFLKAEATSAYALAGEAARKALTAQQDAEKDFGNVDFAANNKLSMLKSALGLGTDYESIGENTQKAINKSAAEIKRTQEKAFADLQKQGDEFEKKAAILAKKNGFAFDPLHDPKGQQNADNLLDQFRKKTLKETQEYLKALDEAELKGYKTIADDQQASLLDRLAAEDQYYKKSLEMAKQNTQDQIDTVNLEADIADKKAGKIKDPKKKADTLIEIENYRVTAIKKISEEGNAATLKINEDYYNQNVQIATQAFDKIKKESEEAAKFIQEQQKIAFQNQKDTVDISKDNQLLQLDKDFQSGKIKNLEEYNSKKQAIENVADLSQKELDLKRIQDAEKVFEALYGIQNLNLIKQAKDLEFEIEKEGNQKILDNQKETNEKKKKFAHDLADYIETALLATNQNQLDRLDKESQDVDKKSQKEIDAINASGLAEEEKQRRITKAQKQAAFEQEQIAKQQDKLNQQRQTLQRLAAVATVGAQIAQEIFSLTAKAAAARAEALLLLINPLTSVLAPAAFAASAAIQGQIPFVLATGGIALAKAAFFKHGTQNAPRGRAVVGEEGSELIVDKSGKMYVTPPKPTLIDLAGGEQIFTADRTKDFLMHNNLLTILQKAQAQKQPVKIENGFNKKAIELLTKIERKAPFIIQVGEKMETTDYYMKNIKR